MKNRGKDGIGVLGGYAAKQCPERTRKDFSPEYSSDLKVAPSAVLQDRLQSGIRFEAELVASLKQLHAGDPSVVFLESPADRSDWAAMKAWQDASMAAFNDPNVRFIVNPRLAPLPDLNLTGEPDFAVRSANGGWYPVDAKEHREMSSGAKPKMWKVSSLQHFSFEDAVEVEMGGTPQVNDSLQLAHYHAMLKGHGLAVPDGSPVYGGIIGTSLQIVWRDLNEVMYSNSRMGIRVSALASYESEMEHRRAILRQEVARQTFPEKAPLSRPEWKPECKDCPWRQVCADELEETDDITLLPGVTVAKATKLRKHGVNRTAELSKLDYRTAALSRAKMNPEQLRGFAEVAQPDVLNAPAESVLKNRGQTLIDNTKLLHRLGFKKVKDFLGIHKRTAAVCNDRIADLPDLIDQARVTRTGKVHLSRDTTFVGFNRAAIEVDVDFEDYEGYTYMFGMLVSQRSVDADGTRVTKSKYESFCSWDESEDGEAAAFAAFWERLTGLQQKAIASRHGFRAFHYTAHEVHAIKTLAERHAGKPGVPTLADVVSFMDSRYWVDMYPIIMRDMVWPTKDYTIKSIAKHCRHSWSGEGVNGALSLVWYKDAVSHADPTVQAERRSDLETYNRQDNEATLRVRDWLTELSTTQRRPGEKLPNVDSLDARYRGRP